MNWNDKIEKIFPRKGVIYLLKDIDYIFDDLNMVKILNDQGISIVDYSDPIHFRYRYEKEFRFDYDSTLIIRTEDFSKIPFDVYSQAFRIVIELSDFIKNLDILAAKESEKTAKYLIELDSKQKQRMSYTETQSLLSEPIIVDSHEDHALLKNNNYDSFGKAAMKIGKWRCESSKLNEERQEYVAKLNRNFQEWLDKNFDQLVSWPPYLRPKMVHQIADVMNQGDYDQKKALIVMDGMSFSQWQIIDNYLLSHNFKTDVHPCLAWIPSITSVSRQSIFAGKVPYEFSNTIGTTNYEEQYWKTYWTENGYEKDDIFYQRALGSTNYFDTVVANNLSNKRIVGCVIDSIDKFMHSAQQGLWSVHSELAYWLEKGFLKKLLYDLIQNQYEVYITSDHGNIESIGVGRINQGILANSKGERVRIYDDQDIRNRTEENYPEISKSWNSNFLPQNFYPLVAKEDFVFTKKGDKIVSHGGTNIEEVYVPFVKVTK